MPSGTVSRKGACLCLVAGALASACVDQRSELVGPLPSSAGPCPALLRDRLTVTQIDVGADVAYAERGYDGFPKLSRIELAAQPSGGALVAWQTADRTTIHVTPLGPDQNRAADDVSIPAMELAGLVGHDDGFALLARQPDPGQPLSVDPSEMGTQAAFLLRYRDGAPAFALALTGTTSPRPTSYYSSALNGQLGYDSARYGAYFAIHAGQGSSMPGLWSDQVSYADEQGPLLGGGWTFGGCSNDDGLRLLAEASGPFSVACLSDGAPQTGLDWMTEGQQAHLAFEEQWDGYTAGRFGSIVRVSDGSHLVVWSSRGDGGQKPGSAGTSGSLSFHARAMDAPDLALMRVGTDGSPVGPVTWLTSTPTIPEITVHVAPYGQDRYLMIWSTLQSCQYDTGNCYGPFGGTFARIIDAAGNPQSGDEELPAWPTDDASLAVFPDGDVGWAFVASRPSYTGRLDPTTVPALHTLSVARLRACQ
jgi:hypothetical protein